MSDFKLPVGTDAPRPSGLVKGMIRPSDWSGMSSGNANVDALKEDSPEMHFEQYDGEKWVKL